MNGTSGVSVSAALKLAVNATSGTVGDAGTFSGGITLTAAQLSPGYGGVGTLTATTLSLASANILNFDINQVNHLTNSIVMTGTLNLNDLTSGVLPKGARRRA